MYRRITRARAREWPKLDHVLTAGRSVFLLLLVLEESGVTGNFIDGIGVLIERFRLLGSSVISLRY